MGDAGGFGRCIAGTLEGRREGEGATTAGRPLELLVAAVAACANLSDLFPGAVSDPFESALLALLDVGSLFLVLMSAEEACCSVLSWTAAGGATGRATKLGAGLSSLFLLADVGALSSRNPRGGASKLTSGACSAAAVAWREVFDASGFAEVHVLGLASKEGGADASGSGLTAGTAGKSAATAAVRDGLCACRVGAGFSSSGDFLGFLPFFLKLPIRRSKSA